MEQFSINTLQIKLDRGSLRTKLWGTMCLLSLLFIHAWGVRKAAEGPKKELDRRTCSIKISSNSIQKYSLNSFVTFLNNNNEF